MENSSHTSAADRHRAAVAAKKSGLNDDLKSICAQVLEAQLFSGNEALDFAIETLKKKVVSNK
tara:strand:+ start:64 stop:252 length:189 start_codon:yes stop_codon:yes gene_type:complete